MMYVSDEAMPLAVSKPQFLTLSLCYDFRHLAVISLKTLLVSQV